MINFKENMFIFKPESNWYTYVGQSSNYLQVERYKLLKHNQHVSIWHKKVSLKQKKNLY